MKYLIAGAGAVGLALMDELHKQGSEIVLVKRDPNIGEKIPDSATLHAIDISDTAKFAELAKDCDAIIHAIGAPLPEWESRLPCIMNQCIAAAELSGKPLLYIDTLDAYGDNKGIPISEATPERPSTAREKLRAKIAQILVQAGNSRRIQHCIARVSDLYGPRVLNSPLGQAVFGAASQGKPVQLLGRLDMPHTFTFVRDMARSVLKLLNDEKSWGNTWHLPSPQPVTQQQILDNIRDINRSVVKYKTINSGMIGLKSLFNAEIKDFEPILYRFENPYVLNHSRFSINFGERVSPHEQAIFETLEWFKRLSGIERRYGF